MVKFAVQDKPDLCLFGVMDGHGEFGHEVSSFVQRRLPQCLDEQPPFSTPEAIHHGIADAVQITEDDLLSAVSVLHIFYCLWPVFREPS